MRTYYDITDMAEVEKLANKDLSYKKLSILESMLITINDNIKRLDRIIYSNKLPPHIQSASAQYRDNYLQKVADLRYFLVLAKNNVSDEIIKRKRVELKDIDKDALGFYPYIDIKDRRSDVLYKSRSGGIKAHKF